MTTPDKDGEYLADGIYVTFDGYQIWLHTERDVNVWHTIALEPATFDLLLAYRAKVYAPVEEAPAFSFLGTTLHHHPSGREWMFTDEEIADVRHYIAAHTDSTLDTGVLFEDAVHRFGSTE